MYKRQYSEREYIPKEVLLGFDTEASEKELLEAYLSERSGRKIAVRIPERGDAKKLCELVCENCREIVSRAEIESEREEKTLIRLAELLKLEVVPERIEAVSYTHLDVYKRQV